MVSITANCEGSVHPQIHYNLKEFSSHSVPVWRRGCNEPHELIPFLWLYEAGLSSYMLLIRRKGWGKEWTQNTKPSLWAMPSQAEKNILPHNMLQTVDILIKHKGCSRRRIGGMNSCFLQPHFTLWSQPEECQDAQGGRMRVHHHSSRNVSICFGL